MRRAVLVLLLLSLGGCDQIAKIKAKPQAEEALRHGLRDPSSTVFRSERVWLDKFGGAVLCGEVNTANGYGGKTGFKRFVSIVQSGKSVVAIEADDDESFSKLFDGMCTNVKTNGLR